MSKTLVCKQEELFYDSPNGRETIFHFVEHQNVSYEHEFDWCYNYHSESLYFKYCNFLDFPKPSSILNHCSQLTLLVIENSKLSRIEAEDLKGFKSLKELNIDRCEIEKLPGDLFKYTRKLQDISFFGNKIKYVGEGLLTPLRSLKYFNLGDNSGIDYCFNSYSNHGSFQELRNKLNELNDSELCRQNKIKALETRCWLLEDRLKETKDEMGKQIERLNKQMQELLQAPLNFVLRVNKKDFKVNKQMLKDHSKTLKNLIDENPETEILEVTEVSEAVFAEILNFMKTGNQPNENVDLVELFGASCRLEIDGLTPIAAGLLQDKINPENALKVLNLCNKYKGHEQLMAKAIEEIKKNIQRK